MSFATLLKEGFAFVRQSLLGVGSDLMSVDQGVEGRCCKLHESVDVDVQGGGCAVVPIGSHPAIQALYFNDSHVCMSEMGQRVLDRRCVAIALGIKPPFGLDLGVRSPTFTRKYFTGFPVAPSVYGRGYCYLWMFPKVVRSRAARICGQHPLIGDVLRLWLVLGEWGQYVYVDLTCVGDGYYHMNAASSGLSVLNAALVMSGIVKNRPGARIGGGTDDREFVPLKVSEGMLFGAAVVRIDGLVVDDRAQEIVEWFSGLGFDLNERCVQELWLVTRASMLYSVTEVISKRHVAMFSHLGDRVLALMVSSRCMAAMLTPADCSGYDAMVKNDSLSSVFLRSGMRDFCDVTGLSVTSKANADIFESVVGVLSTHLSYNMVLKFLDLIGFGFPKPLDHVVTEPMGGTPGLTSLQYRNALRLAAEGKLG